MKAYWPAGKLDMQEGEYVAPRALNLLLALLVFVGTAACFLAVAGAQAPAPGAAPAKPPAAKAPAATRPAGAGPTKVEANLLQLMRGIPYPASNVVFAAQSDISKLEKPADPSVSPNPLTKATVDGRRWRTRRWRLPNPPT